MAALVTERFSSTGKLKVHFMMILNVISLFDMHCMLGITGTPLLAFFIIVRVLN